MSSPQATTKGSYAAVAGARPEAAKQTTPTKASTSKLPNWPIVPNNNPMLKTTSVR